MSGGELNKKRGLKISLLGTHQKEGSLTFAWIKRKTPAHKPELQSNKGSLCGPKSRTRPGCQHKKSSRQKKEEIPEDC